MAGKDTTMNSSTRPDSSFGGPAAEWRLALASLTSAVLFFALFLSILLWPFKNYVTCAGTLEYRNETMVACEVDGVVDRCLKRNFEAVKKDEPILECHLLGLQKYVVRAPEAGILYFNSDRQALEGSFVAKRQVLAYVFNGGEKFAKVVAPLNDIDVFYVGQPVILYYKNPHTFLSRRISSRTAEVFIDKERHSAILYCSFDSQEFKTAQPYPGATVSAKVLINERSLLKNIL